MDKFLLVSAIILPDSQTQKTGMLLLLSAILVLLIASKPLGSQIKIFLMVCFWFLAILTAILCFHFYLLDVNLSKNLIILFTLSGFIELFLERLENKPHHLVVFGLMLVICGLVLLFVFPDVLNPYISSDILTRISQFGDWFFRMVDV